jgi:hypothetical protein
MSSLKSDSSLFWLLNSSRKHLKIIFEFKVLNKYD